MHLRQIRRSPGLWGDRGWNLSPWNRGGGGDVHGRGPCASAAHAVSGRRTTGFSSGDKRIGLYVAFAFWLDIQSWQAQSRTLSEIAFSAKSPGRNFLVQQANGSEVDAERVSSTPISRHLAFSLPSQGAAFFLSVPHSPPTRMLAPLC